MEKFCKFGAGCAYLHLLDPSVDIQKQNDIQKDLKIKLLEEEVILLKSQILQLGVMTRELSDKVELVTNKKMSEYNVSPKRGGEKKIEQKETVSSQCPEVSKYNCDQCSCSFKKHITLQKHKNTLHGKSLKELGEGQFGFVFDVIPGKEEEAKLLRKEWRKDEASCIIEEDTSFSDIDNDDICDSSEDDETFLAKYDDGRNFIG